MGGRLDDTEADDFQTHEGAEKECSRPRNKVKFFSIKAAATSSSPYSLSLQDATIPVLLRHSMNHSE